MHKKQIVLVLLLILIFMFIVSPVYASTDELAIVVTDSEKTQDDIVVQPSTIDIPIQIEGLEDVYAFSISMNFPVDKISVESITNGDVFDEYGNAVVKSDVDNSTGTVEFMQTMLKVDHGVSEDKTLCILRITFQEGEFDLTRDLGLKVQIADSNPQYIDVYVPETKIIVKNPEDTNTSTATPTPQSTVSPTPKPTAQVGVNTPVPGSKESETFEEAEEDIANEVILQVTPTPTPTVAPTATPEPTSMEEITGSDSNDIAHDVDGKSTDLSTWGFIVIVSLLVTGIVVLLIIKRQKTDQYHKVRDSKKQTIDHRAKDHHANASRRRTRHQDNEKPARRRNKDPEA